MVVKRRAPTHLDAATSRIIIVGCGTWGSSTALHLMRRGYQHVTVLDPYPVPSAISAGNDVNKIAESASVANAKTDAEWAGETVRADAIEAWKTDPVFNDFYHETGYVIAATKSENVKHLWETEHPTPERGFAELNNAKDFRNTMPEGVLTGDFPGWKGWYTATGSGWVSAYKALTAAAQEAERLGARLICGSLHGNVVKLIHGANGDVKGVRTADEEEHLAEHIILCAGANAPQLLDMQDQLRPTAWTLAQIKLTDEEARLYKNLPVLFNIERGFFMETEDGQLKICDEHPGYCNWTPDAQTQTSLPFSRHQIPKISEDGVRAFLKETMPHFASRPFSFARICWCADTPDRHFLISQHPDYPCLTLGVGGSGHGFMQIPVIGKYIVDCMENKLDPRMRHTWRWRPETAERRNWQSTQDRFGGKGVVMNLQEVEENEWTSI